MTLETFNAIALVVGYVAIVGIAGLIAFVVYVFADEARRSYRQVRRIERITLGKGKRAPWRVFARHWRAEYLDGYSSLHVRGFVLPHDTSKPITRDW